MDDEDLRRTELDSLEAIFPELSREKTYTISLDIPVALLQPVKVIFPASENSINPTASLHDALSFHTKSSESFKPEVCYFWNLPPLKATITLPEDYPAQAPPHVKLESGEKWIPEKKLRELEGSWDLLREQFGHDLVVYSFIEQLQEAAELCFGLPSQGTLDLPPELKISLLDYDAEVKRAKFDNETFDCGVCLEPKKGAACHRLLSCGHVFCVACLQGYYNSCITEGDIDGVRCLDPSCGKDRITHARNTRSPRKLKQLQPSELLQIPISEETVQRFVRLQKKRRLETNPNTVYCPRTWCQAPARVGDDPDSGEESQDGSGDIEDISDGVGNGHDTAPAEEEDDAAVENSTKAKLRPPSECLAVCTECSFAFCIVCKRSWHGELGFCVVRHERLYSREEKATEEYLRKFTSPCPTCSVRCQKILGCNHMICRQCQTHFCYLCSSWLDSSNPYSHFNTVGRPCYQRLWELEGGDGEGAPERPQARPVEVIFEDDRGEAGNGGRQRREEDREPVHVPPPAPQPPVDGIRVRRRVQQGLARPAPIVPHIPRNQLQGHGLQRFLELAERDEEDGWDSDELEDQFIQFVIRDR